MYEYKKRPGKLKIIFLNILLIASVSSVIIFIYNTYVNVDEYEIENSQGNQKAIRLSQKTEENIEENKEEDITSVLEKTIKCVVGISKIKNTGNSIFLNNSTEELGLGTGMIITDNRVYFN